MRNIYEALFYSLYIRHYMINKSNPEVNSIIFLALYLSLYINFIIPLYFFEIELIDYPNYKIYAFAIITIILLFNYVYFEKNQYYKDVVLKLKDYQRDYIFNIVGIVFPILTLLFLFLILDFQIMTILMLIGFFSLIEICTSIFGNKWK